MLFLLLRPDDTSRKATPATPSTPTPTDTSSVSASPSPAASPSLDRTLIEVTYRDGAVQGPTRFSVTLGDRLLISVRADVADEVHLHGFDLMADVEPGEPARIDLVADAAGVFECELEDAGTLLFRLEIVP